MSGEGVGSDGAVAGGWWAVAGGRRGREVSGGRRGLMGLRAGVVFVCACAPVCLRARACDRASERVGVGGGGGGPVDQRAVRVGAGLGPRGERAEEDAQLVERVEVRGEVVLRLRVLVALGALADAPKEEAEHEEREDGVPADASSQRVGGCVA